MLRDELHEPLGLRPSPAAPPRRGGGTALVAIAAFVVAGVAVGQVSLIRNVARSGRSPASTAVARLPAAPETPPLRLSAGADSPPAPAFASPAPALAETAAAPRIVPADTAAAPAKAKPARARAGAPEPLIIDVQQALAALRAQEASSVR